MPGESPEQALEKLLRSTFDADEFRRFVRGLEHGEELEAIVLGRWANDEALFHEAVRALRRRGELDSAFFVAFVAARPKKSAQIQEVAAMYEVALELVERRPPNPSSPHPRGGQMLPTEPSAPATRPVLDVEVLERLQAFAEGPDFVEHRETTSLHLLHALLAGPYTFPSQATLRHVASLPRLESLLRQVAARESADVPPPPHITTTESYERILQHARALAEARPDARHAVTVDDVLKAMCKVRPSSVAHYLASLDTHRTMSPRYVESVVWREFEAAAFPQIIRGGRSSNLLGPVLGEDGDDDRE